MKSDLVAWMDARNLSAEEVGRLLGVSAQTVRNWRSQGVPKRRESHVRMLIDEWEARRASGAELGKLILRPTEEQFRRWNRASISGFQPQTIEDWAMDALECAAEMDLEGGGRRVAEEVPSYGGSGES